MSESFNTPSDKAGFAPGSLVHVGAVLDTATRITVTQYTPDLIEEQQLQSIEEIQNYKDSERTTWVVIEGLTDIDIVERIGAILGIHHLVLEDILNTHQRPKFEEYDDHLYIVLKGVTVIDQHFNLSYEQISILLVDRMVIMFKEKKDELFSPLQRRLRKSKGQLRRYGPDYLSYEILDTIVDHYFTIIDSLDDAITSVEDSLLASEQDHELLQTIQKLRREVILIRRYISPVRELLAEMLRSESDLLDEKINIYLRDVSDHAVRVTDSIESYRDILTGLQEIYISGVSNKLNEIMKVLTVFASIFIPLTFLAGIYGMNFEYMPELKWRWAYPALWALFIIIPVTLLVYFKRKKWL